LRRAIISCSPKTDECGKPGCQEMSAVQLSNWEVDLISSDCSGGLLIRQFSIGFPGLDFIVHYHF
jgi:hypothetical protein